MVKNVDVALKLSLCGVSELNGFAQCTESDDPRRLNALFTLQEYTTGTQTHLSLFGLNPGGAYVVQVRGRIDHGQWSEWSNDTCVTMPDSESQDN